MFAVRSPFVLGRTRWVFLCGVLIFLLGDTATTAGVVDDGPSAVFVPITPCRILDTRPSPETVGARSTPLQANESHAVQVLGTNGNCTISMDAVALTMNVAAVNPTGNSFLTVHPSGLARPLTANLNWTAGQPPVSNAVTVDIGHDGAIIFYNLTGNVDLAVDVVGYFVDHAHDDRYASAVQTLQVHGSALNLQGIGQLTLDRGCAGSSADDATGRLDLPLPVGAAIRGVRVTTLDGPSDAGYTVALLRSIILPDRASDTDIAMTTGGILSGTVQHVLTPQYTEVVQLGTAYSLAVSLGSGSGNAICQVSIDYDMTP